MPRPKQVYDPFTGRRRFTFAEVAAFDWEANRHGAGPAEDEVERIVGSPARLSAVVAGRDNIKGTRLA